MGSNHRRGTKSRAYSVTFTSIRAERRTWRLRADLDQLATHTDNHGDPATPADLEAITVVNDWRVVHIGHHDHAERELALAIAERHQPPRLPHRREGGMNNTGSDARTAWRTTYRMDRIFDRIVTTDGWGWLRLRAALWCSECGREITTPPLPLNTTSDGPLEALHTAFVTHLTETCEPGNFRRRSR